MVLGARADSPGWPRSPSWPCVPAVPPAERLPQGLLRELLVPSGPAAWTLHRTTGCAFSEGRAGGAGGGLLGDVGWGAMSREATGLQGSKSLLGVGQQPWLWQVGKKMAVAQLV